MRISSFVSKKLHGYLDFELSFNGDLNFLTGINGSGKTSILRAIMALLSPDIAWFSETKFSLLEVKFYIESNEYKISVKKARTVLHVNFIKNGVSGIGKISTSRFRQMTEQNELIFEEEGYSAFELPYIDSVLDKTGVLKEIRKLPTPIFIGLDRTAPTTQVVHTLVTRTQRGMRANTTSPLDRSVGQAESSLAEAVRVARGESARLAAKLRAEILLSLFSDVKRTSFSTPTRKDIRKYERARKSLKEAFQKLEINPSDIEQHIDAFFTNVMAIAEKIADSRISEIMREINHPLQQTLQEWFNVSNRLPLISKAEELVQTFNEKDSAVFEKIVRYCNIINSFFRDSNKQIDVLSSSARNSAKPIRLTLPSGETENLYLLSSGEKQILLLITTLMFSNDTANILIIDEPELSLHLRWQEMFVQSLQEANPSTQIILATHSPAIIVANEDKCIGLL